MPYIKELSLMSSINRIVIVSPRVNYDFRIEMGWNDNDLLPVKGIEYLIAPSSIEIESLLNNCSNTNSQCIFSGINAFKEVAEWFILSLKYKVKRSIITEPPFIYKKPLWMHGIRFLFKDLKYIKYIDNIFVMGESYLWYYRMWSKQWNVIPFMYCTESFNRNLPTSNDKNLKVLYVGSFSRRKNVQLLLKATKDIEGIEVGLVGSGDQQNELERISGQNVIFYGSQPMNLISEYMQRYDVLVLPSLYDGWGAVVNEALTLGLYVICSDTCGAQSLIKDKTLGLVFKNNNLKSLRKVLYECKNNLSNIRKNVNARINWSQKNISGKAIADYFITNLKGIK